MQIIAVNNNYIRIIYNNKEEFYSLGELVKFTDARPFQVVGQILGIQSVKENSVYYSADIRLLFNLDNANNLTQWSGKVPAGNSKIDKINFNNIKKQAQTTVNNISLGHLTSYSNEEFVLNINDLKNNTIIFSDKKEEKTKINEYLFDQIQNSNKKQLLIDFNGDFDDIQNVERITAGVDFKLPLNYEIIEYLYEYSLSDASAESKAIIQDVFFEVQNYANTIPDKFIPFGIFKNVVDEEYDRSNLTELVLLKNKLLKYNQQNIFASDKSEFLSLGKALKNNKAVILDLSKIPQDWHKKFVDFAMYSSIKEETILFAEIENYNFDEKLISKILKNRSILPVFTSGYEAEFNDILKSIANNMILFTPINQPADYPCYASFLEKLNPSEFIVYGKFSYFVPLFVNIEFPTEEIQEEELIEQIIEPVQEEEITREQEENIDFEQTQESENEIPNIFDQEYEEPQTEEYGFVTDTEDETLDIEEPAELETEAQEYTQEAENNVNSEEILEYDEEFDFDFSSDDLDAINQLQEDAPQVVEENLPQAFEEQLTTEDHTPEVFEEIKSEEHIAEEISNEVQSLFTVKPKSEPSKIPVYPAGGQEEHQNTAKFQEGDIVSHPKYGKGLIKKIIGYGNKKLCSIQFDNVGRRLLDPTLADIEKIN